MGGNNAFPDLRVNTEFQLTLRKERCEPYPTRVRVRVRVRLTDEKATTLHTWTVQEGPSAALVVCSTCGSVLKQDVARIAGSFTLAVADKMRFRTRDNRLAPERGTLFSIFQEPDPFEFHCDQFKPPDLNRSALNVANATLKLLHVRKLRLL